MCNVHCYLKSDTGKPKNHVTGFLGLKDSQISYLKNTFHMQSYLVGHI